MRYLRLALFLLTVCGALSPVAQAGEILDHIRNTDTVVVGYREALPPYSYKSGDRVSGYSIEVCERLVHAMSVRLKHPNLKMVIKPVSAENRVPLTKKGGVGEGVDFNCGSDSITERRRNEVNFVAERAIDADFIAIAYQETGGRKYTSISDLRGLTLAVVNGTTGQATVSRENEAKSLGISVIATKDYPTAFEIVRNGSAVGVVSDRRLLEGEISKPANNGKRFVVSQTAFVGADAEAVGLMIAKSDPEFNALARQAFDDISGNAEILKLHRKYFPTESLVFASHVAGQPYPDAVKYVKQMLTATAEKP